MTGEQTPYKAMGIELREKKSKAGRISQKAMCEKPKKMEKQSWTSRRLIGTTE